MTPQPPSAFSRFQPISRRAILAVPLLSLPHVAVTLPVALATPPGWVVRSGWVLKAADR